MQESNDFHNGLDEFMRTRQETNKRDRITRFDKRKRVPAKTPASFWTGANPVLPGQPAPGGRAIAAANNKTAPKTGRSCDYKKTRALEKIISICKTLNKTNCEERTSQAN